MKRFFFLLALLAPLPIAAQVVTRDTTVYTATRIRTAANGTILSISVAKIATPVPGKTDTVKVASPPIHDTVTVTKVAGRDTVAWWPTQTANRFNFNLVSWSGGRGQPAPFLIPTIIVHDTIPTRIVHDTVTRIVHDTVYATRDTTAGPAQLPRTFMDTRMPIMRMSGDTLSQDPVTHVWTCRGPCLDAAPRLKALNAAARARARATSPAPRH
jgi:hypothetical protein